MGQHVGTAEVEVGGATVQASLDSMGKSKKTKNKNKTGAGPGRWLSWYRRRRASLAAQVQSGGENCCLTSNIQSQ